MIKAGMDQIAVLKQQLRIFVDEHPSHSGHKSSPHVKGVIVDGVISCDDNVVKKAIKDFWESLLSTERPYNKDSLNKLIADHHSHGTGSKVNSCCCSKVASTFHQPLSF